MNQSGKNNGQAWLMIRKSTLFNHLIQVSFVRKGQNPYTLAPSCTETYVL